MGKTVRVTKQVTVDGLVVPGPELPARVEQIQLLRGHAELRGVGQPEDKFRFGPSHGRAVFGGDFVERIKHEVGLDLEVISGSEEARLVHLAVVRRIPLGNRTWLLADLGGGSVEVSLVDQYGTYWSESHTMGSVRLLEELTEAGADPGETVVTYCQVGLRASVTYMIARMLDYETRFFDGSWRPGDFEKLK